jgi:hypothetical protein
MKREQKGRQKRPPTKALRITVLVMEKGRKNKERKKERKKAKRKRKGKERKEKKIACRRHQTSVGEFFFFSENI